MVDLETICCCFCFCSVSVNIPISFSGIKFCYLVWSGKKAASPWDISRYDLTSSWDLSRYDPTLPSDLSKYKVNIYEATSPWDCSRCNVKMYFCLKPFWVWSCFTLRLFRWFKFTLKPPYTVAHGNLLSAIWGTFHWTSFVKFGLKMTWNISYDIL